MTRAVTIGRSDTTWGITAFGATAWTADVAGDRVINEHDEDDPGADQELFLVACALPRGQMDLFLQTPGRDPSRASSKRTPSPSTVLVSGYPSSSRPWRCATAVAPVRVEAPSLARMRETCTLAVLGEMKSVSAI